VHRRRCGFGALSRPKSVIGVYPLKANFSLNVRRGNHQEKIQRTKGWGSKEILGLENGALEYSIEAIGAKLRYSRILDSPVQGGDGSHIKYISEASFTPNGRR
jgi:hypothetical protein